MTNKKPAYRRLVSSDIEARLTDDGMVKIFDLLIGNQDGQEIVTFEPTDYVLQQFYRKFRPRSGEKQGTRCLNILEAMEHLPEIEEIM